MSTTNGFNRAVPFHWAGGKKWMATIILAYLPAVIERLLIPFFGRGDFIRVMRGHGIEVPALVSDIHPKVMTTHAGILDNPSEVIRLLREHQSNHSSKHFIAIRDSYNPGNPAAVSAAAFMYSMNGSYKACFKQRVDGSHTNVSARRQVSCQEAAIYAHSIALRNTTLFTEDFVAMIMRARRGDLVLLDPPYVNAMGYGGIAFTAYDHMRLHSCCERLHRLGAHFLLTANDEPFVSNLYKNFAMEVVAVPRGLGVKRTATELIVTNY